MLLTEHEPGRLDRRRLRGRGSPEPVASLIACGPGVIFNSMIVRPSNSNGQETS